VVKQDSRILEEIKNLDINSMTFLELSKVLKVNEKTVRTVFKRNEIVKSPQKANQKIPEYDLIVKLNKEGYSSAQIAKKVGTSVRQVTVFKDSLKIHKSRFCKVEVDNIFYEVIIGSLLGDGCVARTNIQYDYYSFVESHCIKQEQYILWKKSILEKYIKTDYYKKWIVDERFKNKGSFTCRIYCNSHPIFKELRSVFYPKGKKIVPDLVFEYLTPLALSIWFQDDGTRPKNGGYVISTMSFEKKEVEKLE